MQRAGGDRRSHRDRRIIEAGPTADALVRFWQFSNDRKGEERQYANLDIVMKLLRHLCSASSVAPLALLRGSPVRPAQKPQIVRDFGSSPLRVREVRTDLEFRRQFGFPGAIADA